MAVINTNVKALFSQAALKRTEGAMSNAMAQLSTGKRINTAADDAAGLAIATRMTHQVRSLNQAIRNAGDAINLIQTAEGATNEITDMMQRMRELAIQAVNDTNDNPQRSYLDLEFQQLKAEIVHIAESTEWNGFPVLNGTAGERVGEMPVFKTTAVGRYDDVFASGVTITGDGAGEVQTLDFSDTTTWNSGVAVNVGPYEIYPTSTTLTAAGFADAVVTALEADTDFVASGRTVALATGGEGIVITYPASEGNVTPITFNARGSGASASVSTDRQGVARTVESFADQGAFIQQGQLQISLDATTGDVSAVFTNLNGQELTMVGESSLEDGTITFRALDATNPDNRNGLVISQNLVYTFKDFTGAALDMTSRDVTLGVQVGPAVAALEAGDLIINGVDIGASYASDDTLSPPNNAAGSAIAMAAAINRMAGDTGMSVGESQSILFTGVPVAGETISVGGVNIQLTSNERTAAQAAAKIASELRNSTLYNQSTGRVISYAPGSSTVKIDFPIAERNVASTLINTGSTGLQAVVDTTQEFTTVRAGTGVFAKVNENIFTGQAMAPGASMEGVVFINGYAAADITTVLNNTRATREQVVNAVNAISAKTGVKAVDTGFDEKGITLLAADGRNIEVQFQTSGNAADFGQLIGLRQGVNTATYSLQSKIEAPIVITSAATGEIQRTGLIEGNFTRNQSVFNTSPRPAVSAPVAQTMAVNISGTVADGDTFSVTVNGRTISATASSADDTDNPQAMRDALIAAMASEGVTASEGRGVGELLLTADMPGTPFTLAVKGDATNTGNISFTTVQENQVAQFKPLGKDDLVLNGIKIRATTAKDDTLSSSVAASSDPASSAIAIANAINYHSAETGVRAVANAVVSKGLSTETSVPAGSAYQDLFINGTRVQVLFTENEAEEDRRNNVVAEINRLSGQHGVTATNNGNGVTLESDGRNLSVWYDSSIKDLSPASFGLDKAGAVAQTSRITIGGTVANLQEAFVTINGIEISAVAASTDAADLARALADAISASIDDETLSNIAVSVDGDQIEITSTIPGAPFTLSQSRVDDATVGTEVTIEHVIANSAGDNDITGIAGASATSTEAKTLYGTVRLISDPALLPKLPSPIGAPPSDQLEKLKATGRPFTIAVGDMGFSTSANFSVLGFQEGTFGGRSSEDMDPPRVGRLAFQVGPSANQYITIDLADFGKGGLITGELTGDIDLNVEDRRTRINTREGASSVLRILDDAMDKVNATRATMGAVMNRLDHVINNLSNVSMNLSESRSHIEDADYAKASTDLAKTQIMQQAATAVLAQANTSQQTVLKLLGG
jgi:flagellin